MDNTTSWQTPTRIASFVDGVVVTAMTILILNVQLPEAAPGTGGESLINQLQDIWPNVVSYLASFIVIAMYWIGYNIHFRALARIDSQMLWLVVVFLLLIGFIPFASNLIGDHPEALATAIYAGTQIAIALCLIIMARHARRRHLFPPTHVDDRPFLAVVGPWLRIIAVFGLSIVVALLWQDAARPVWLLLALPDTAVAAIIRRLRPPPRS